MIARTDTTTQLYGWVLDLGKVDYERVLNWQRGLVKLRKEGFARDTIIFVEHPPVITVGRDGHQENFSGLDQEPIPVERGGTSPTTVRASWSSTISLIWPVAGGTCIALCKTSSEG